MRKSLEDQLLTTCVYFTGIQHNECKKNIDYRSFPKGSLPCLAMGTAGLCPHVQFPTKAEVEEKIADIRKASNQAVDLFMAARQCYDRTQNKQDTFRCPHGEHDAKYTRASNGHFWISCKTCNINLNE